MIPWIAQVLRLPPPLSIRMASGNAKSTVLQVLSSSLLGSDVMFMVIFVSLQPVLRMEEANPESPSCVSVP